MAEHLGLLRVIPYECEGPLRLNVGQISYIILGLLFGFFLCT